MKTHLKILASVALTGAVVLLGVTAAYSQPPGGRGGHGGFGGHGRHGGPGGDSPMFLLHGLDLTDAQQSQVDALVEGRQETAEAQHEAMQAARKGLHEMVLAGTYSDAAAAPFIDAIAKASGEFARLHAQLGSEIYNVLTPEQRTEVAARAAKFEEHRGFHGRH